MRLNVTAVYTIEQVKEITEAVTGRCANICFSICRTYCRYRRRSITINERGCKVTHSKDGVKLLWASCRELFNVIQADEIGADIITCPADVVKK